MLCWQGLGNYMLLPRPEKGHRTKTRFGTRTGSGIEQVTDKYKSWGL